MENHRNMLGGFILGLVALYVLTQRVKLKAVRRQQASRANTYVWDLYPNLPEDWIYNVPQKTPQDWFVAINNVSLPDKPLSSSLSPYNQYSL